MTTLCQHPGKHPGFVLFYDRGATLAMLWGIGGWVIACDHEVSIINYKHTFHIIEMVSLLLNS